MGRHTKKGGVRHNDNEKDFHNRTASNSLAVQTPSLVYFQGLLRRYHLDNTWMHRQIRQGDLNHFTEAGLFCSTMSCLLSHHFIIHHSHLISSSLLDASPCRVQIIHHFLMLCRVLLINFFKLIHFFSTVCLLMLHHIVYNLQKVTSLICSSTLL